MNEGQSDLMCPPCEQSELLYKVQWCVCYISPVGGGGGYVDGKGIQDGVGSLGGGRRLSHSPHQRFPYSPITQVAYGLRPGAHFVQK